jgi:hypothetical protein
VPFCGIKKFYRTNFIFSLFFIHFSSSTKRVVDDCKEWQAVGVAAEK